MNKNLLILPAMVFTMGLASCAKTISRDDALKFVKENYKNTEAKTVTKRNVSWSYAGTKGEYCIGFAKSILINETGLKASDITEKGSKEITEFSSEWISKSYPMNENNLPKDEETEGTKLSYTFKLKGKELTIINNAESKSEKITMKGTQTTTYNSDGYATKVDAKFDKTVIDEDNVFVLNYSYTNTY